MGVGAYGRLLLGRSHYGVERRRTCACLIRQDSSPGATSYCDVFLPSGEDEGLGSWMVAVVNMTPA